MENPQKQTNDHSLKTTSEGIDSWNDRLDENLEPKETGNAEADENARKYSDEKGSGEQSDETVNDQ